MGRICMSLDLREEWSQNRVLSVEFTILDHVLFPRNHEGFDTELLQFQSKLNEVILSSYRSYPMLSEPCAS